MPIPSSISDLSTTAASNSPSGADSPTEGDNFLRAIQAIVRTTYDADQEWKDGRLVSVVSLGVAADGTDQTTPMITALGAESAGVFLVPYNVKFTPKTLLQSMPTNQVLLDLSSVNDYSSAGETNKCIGILSADTATNDTHWSIGSGHHAVLTLNNHGTSGTTSADERKGTILWATGKLELGSTDKRGYRGAAMLQFTKATSESFWTWGMRSLAPWAAIDAEYENWATGQTISGAGVYRASSVAHYVSTGAGTTGATEPTHTSGTVSDGGVSWTHVASIDSTVFSVDQYGRWLLGAGATGDTWNHKVSTSDPSGGAYSFVGSATGASKVSQLRLTPTDSGGTEVEQPYLLAQDGVGLRIMKSDASTDLARFGDSAGLAHKTLTSLSATVTSGATPSVAGVGTLFLDYASPASITALSGGVDDQIVDIVMVTSNITFVHSSTLVLQGSANLTTPAAWSSIRFKKIPASISDRWVEVGRCIK